jgi:hypothetical protein
MAGKKYYGYHGQTTRRREAQSSDELFGWTVFLFLLIGFVFLCWMGSYYIFARPENAANYSLLQRLHKLEPPQRFEITAAPRGEFLKPGELLDRFGSMTTGEIHSANQTLLRSFVRNYHQNRDLVPYAVGTYRVIGTLPLSEENFCRSGMVALLQAVEQPEVLLEQIFTADETNLPALQRSLSPGQEIKLEKPLDLSAVIHIDRLPDHRIRLTTMPLLYGTYGAGKGPASFSLKPPDKLNLHAGLPVLTVAQIGELSDAAAGGGPLKNSAHLTRIPDEPVAPVATPEPRVAKAIPVESQSPDSGSNTSTNEPVARAIPVNVPPVLPAIPVGVASTPATTPEPQVARAVPFDTPLPKPASTIAKAVIPPSVIPSITPNTVDTHTVSPPPATVPTALATSSNSATPPSSAGAWPVYAPGQMPRGELLDPSESQSLARRGAGKQRHYLQGRFSVTASGNGKAVLRPETSLGGLSLGPSSKVRVIVEFPPGTEPPSEGNTVTRDNMRPFQIISVKRGDDGQINVYAREVTRGE